MNRYNTVRKYTFSAGATEAALPLPEAEPEPGGQRTEVPDRPTGQPHKSSFCGFCHEIGRYLHSYRKCYVLFTLCPLMEVIKDVY